MRRHSRMWILAACSALVACSGESDIPSSGPDVKPWKLPPPAEIRSRDLEPSHLAPTPFRLEDSRPFPAIVRSAAFWPDGSVAQLVRVDRTARYLDSPPSEFE